MSYFHMIRKTDAGSRPFRKFLGAFLAALLFCFGFSCHANAIVVNFANLPGTELSFSGGGFTFTSTGGGYQFDITSVNNGVGDSVGLNGYVSPGGPFTIGTITTIGAEQTASVFGSGMLHITDANSIDLTGAIQWENITTFGVGGILDLSGAINLTGLTYSGANSDLAALAAGGSGTDVITFQFAPAQTLTQLATTGGQTSYSGSITVTPVPEPGTLTMAGFAALVGLLARSFRRK